MDWRKILTITGIGIVVYFGMQYLLPIAIPFFIGWILAVKIFPAAVWIEKKTHISRGIAGGVLIFLLVSMLGYISYKFFGAFFSQTGNIIQVLRNRAGDPEILMERCCCFMERYTGIEKRSIRSFIVEKSGIIQEELKRRGIPLVFSHMGGMLKGIAAAAGGLLTSVIFGTLLIKDMEKINAFIRGHKAIKKIDEIVNRIGSAGGMYFKGQLYIMGIISVICMGGLWLLRDPYYLAGGLAVGILDMFPVLGTGTVLIPCAVLFFVRGQYAVGTGYLILYAVTYLAREFLEPRILGKNTGIHPTVMMASIYTGFFLYGLKGFVLGPATLLIIRIVYCEIVGSSTKANKKDTKKP